MYGQNRKPIPSPQARGYAPAGAHDAYLAERYGKAFEEQRELNRNEYCKDLRAESRKSLNAARREALKAARDNPPSNFRCVLYNSSRSWRAGGMDDTQRAKRSEQAFKDAGKMGVCIEEEAPPLAQAS